jgi:hypothetical protein
MGEAAMSVDKPVQQKPEPHGLGVLGKIAGALGLLVYVAMVFGGGAGQRITVFTSHSVRPAVAWRVTVTGIGLGLLFGTIMRCWWAMGRRRPIRPSAVFWSAWAAGILFPLAILAAMYGLKTHFLSDTIASLAGSALLPALGAMVLPPYGLLNRRLSESNAPGGSSKGGDTIGTPPRSEKAP